MSVIYFLAALAVAPWLIVIADRLAVHRAFARALAGRKAARALDAQRVKGLRLNTGPLPVVEANPQPVQDATPTPEPVDEPQPVNNPDTEPVVAAADAGVLAKFEMWQRQNREQTERGRHWAADVEDTVLPGPATPYRNGWFEAMDAAHDDAAVSA